MGSMSNPKTWVPYMNTKDCSQGFCSLYCPQWCYIIFPPPPPFEFPDDNSGPNFLPLVIGIVGILASAFLLVSYYAIISKYCRNRDSSRRGDNHYPTAESDEIHDPSNHEPWHVPNNGLDEALIKSITVFKFKKGDGLTEGTDCSVCLSEFQEDESLRLLPKCSHAFHAMCIDTWLKSHPHCPLCRANIVFVNSLPSQLVIEIPPNNESLSQSPPLSDNAAPEEDREMGVSEGDSISTNIRDHPTREASNLEDSDHSSSISTNIRDVEGEPIRRSVSMDYLCPGRLSIADILRINHDEDDQMEDYRFPYDVGTSKEAATAADMSRSSNRNRVLHCITGPSAIKRSFSSGRFLFSKYARGRNVIIPL